MNAPDFESAGWLTPEAKCLLKDANGHRRVALQQCCLWHSTGLIDRLDRELYPLLPNVYRALRTQGIVIPGMDRLKGMYRYTWSKNERVMQQLAPVADAFRDRDLDAVITGDTALAVAYYRDLGRRPIFRVEILIRPNQGSAAMALLRR